MRFSLASWELVLSEGHHLLTYSNGVSQGQLGNGVLVPRGGIVKWVFCPNGPVSIWQVHCQPP